MAENSKGNIILGIDLGGTKIMAVAIDADGKILGRAKDDTPSGAELDVVAKRMRELGADALKEAKVGWDEVRAVGLAVPSSVDPATGMILHAPALGWRNLPAKEVLEKVFGRPVTLDNDVNCGVLAEARLGAGKGLSCVAGYFVGTGTGGGIVLDGRIIHGRRGVAGELGHETLVVKGRRCGCGKRGCLEAYCSKTAFARRLDKLIHRRKLHSLLADLDEKDFKNLKSKALAKAYRQGDAVVCGVVDQGAKMLGVAVANLMAILGPDGIILGGGVMEALGKELLPIVRASAEKHLFGIGSEDLNLKLSELGDDAVALGAALLTGGK